MVDPRSRFSVRKTADAVYVDVIEGQVLVKAPRGGARPVVVTAGQAQIREVAAAICVGVAGNTTSVVIIDGVARVGVVDLKDRGHVVSEVRVRTGDRVEVSRRDGGVMLRIGMNAAKQHGEQFGGLRGCSFEQSSP